MKLFKYTCGVDDVYGAAKDEQDAYDRRAEVDPTFHFIQVKIEEVKLAGYEIVMQSNDAPSDQGTKTVDDTKTVDEIKAWLNERGIEYHPQLGEKKLRDLYSRSVQA